MWFRNNFQLLCSLICNLPHFFLVTFAYQYIVFVSFSELFSHLKGTAWDNQRFALLYKLLLLQIPNDDVLRLDEKYI